MTLRVLATAARSASVAASTNPQCMASARRSFQTSARRLDAVAAPVKKPVGAFRGGLFGFLLGSSVAGAGVYYYILDEYRVSNTLLQEDIYALQGAVQRIEAYTRSLEERVGGGGGAVAERK